MSQIWTDPTNKPLRDEEAPRWLYLVTAGSMALGIVTTGALVARLWSAL